MGNEINDSDTIYIATVSGGKDSVTMCDMLLKNGYQVDYIIFNDTLNEFDEMYEYIDKVNEYFKSRYGKEITITKPTWTYEEYILGKRTRGKREGITRGLPTAGDGFCRWRSNAKIEAFDKWVKDNNIQNYKIYMGITLDETHRTNREDGKFLYPLIDDFKMREKDCQQYLINQEMENPLYRHFTRTGCANCHFQSDRDFFNIWKHYPKVWEHFKYYENEVSKQDDIGEEGRYWFTNYRTCEDMEKQFIKADKQGSLFDFSDEPLKDCFCKI